MYRYPAAAALLVLLTSQSAHAYEAQYAFMQVGKLKLDDNASTINVDGATLKGKYDDLPFATAGVQRVLGGQRWRYGYEGGAIISWQNDAVSYSGVVNGGATVRVKVDNDLFVFGTMLGAYGDLNFSDQVRVFVSGGPMLLGASLKQDSDEQDGTTLSSSGTVVINGTDRDFSFGYGAYASAGLIIAPTRQAEFGVVVRQQDVHLDFSDAAADVPYDGTQLLLSFGYRL